MTPEELEKLAHLRRARDHGALESVPGCIAKDATRPSRKSSRIGEMPAAAAP